MTILVYWLGSVLVWWEYVAPTPCRCCSNAPTAPAGAAIESPTNHLPGINNSHPAPTAQKKIGRGGARALKL